MYVKDVYTFGLEVGSFKVLRRRSKKFKLESSDEDVFLLVLLVLLVGDDKYDVVFNVESDAEENEDYVVSNVISGNEDDVVFVVFVFEDDVVKSDVDDEYDIDEDDSYKKEILEEYFINKRYKSYRYRWLVGFYEYLARFSVGNKKDNIRF